MLPPQHPRTIGHASNTPSEETEQPGIQEIRHEIRNRSIQERDALSPELRHLWSRNMIERLTRYLHDKPYRSIHCYISFRSEAETHEFIELSLQEGMRVTVPIVERIDNGKILIHSEIGDLAGLVSGHFGLKEPLERKLPSLDALQAVIVPLVAFDREGTRLGYGMGFYDAFLHTLPRTVERIGLAFSTQEVNHIPALSHDEPLDTIVTELEIIHVR
jgi:5-formyltetrahydrofolate cyclo-ligase